MFHWEKTNEVPANSETVVHVFKGIMRYSLEPVGDTPTAG